ncbi:MAG: hypothetical protein KC438_12205 [Thermomicrobiales bacterium]|nr:hypothetical protein [Thermomicrobiales bacterium]
MHYDEDEFYPDQLKVALADAVVMSIFFMRIGNALILDFRTAEGINPAIRVDGMAATPRDRLLSFRELRPELPIPQEITLAPWAERVREFERAGVLQCLLDRCDEVGGIALMTQARTAYLKLLNEEKKILRELVTGHGMETIWERPSSR